MIILWILAIFVPWLANGQRPRTLEGEYIIQIAPKVSIASFLGAYPDLSKHMRGALEYGHFQVIYGTFDRRIMRFLRPGSAVVDISPDVTVKIFDVQADAPRHLARISQSEPLAAEGPYDYVYDPSGGKGIDVYLFDSGVNPISSEFGNRVSHGADLTEEGFEDENGHGTCVAGIVGSQTYGVAKNVNLISVKVINSEGRGKLSWVLQAIGYVIEAKTLSDRPSVINMSLGTPRNSILNNAVQQLYDMDIAVVAAVGNADSPACSMSPASASTVLSIGAFDDRYDTIASFSNWGQCVDAFAPGVNVASVSYQDGSPIVYSGTSVASPIGAGLVAYFMGMGDSGRQAVQRVSRHEQFHYHN